MNVGELDQCERLAQALDGHGEAVEQQALLCGAREEAGL
jgi:hypothetical protein